jgi:hypothetical protein
MHVHVIISLPIHDQNLPFKAILAAVAAASELVGITIVAMDDESWRVATRITPAAGLCRSSHGKRVRAASL